MNNNTDEIRNILNQLRLLEARIEHPEVVYTDEKSKVIAELRSHKSAVYTKLADRLETIDRMEAQIKEYKLEMKSITKEHVADLFDADDAVKTRVVDTISFIITLSKTPAPTTSYQYMKILAELANHLTPELLVVLNDLKEKFKTESQREPSISVDRKKVDESIGNKLQHYFAKFKHFIVRWAYGYDHRLNILKKRAANMSTNQGVSEGLTPEDIHRLADHKGIPWDNDPSFLKLTKKLTGKKHLDDLDQNDLKKVKKYLEQQDAEAADSVQATH